MVVMWLAVIWLAALWPSAAQFYSINLSASDDHPSAKAAISIEPGAGPWIVFVAVLLIIVAGSLQMYWDRLGTFSALTVATFTLTAVLILVKRRAVQVPRLEATHSMTVDPGQV